MSPEIWPCLVCCALDTNVRPHCAAPSVSAKIKKICLDGRAKDKYTSLHVAALNSHRIRTCLYGCICLLCKESNISQMRQYRRPDFDYTAFIRNTKIMWVATRRSALALKILLSIRKMKYDPPLKSSIGRFQHFVKTTLVTLWHRLNFEIVQLAIWTRRQPAKLIVESSPWDPVRWWFALSAPLPYAVCPWGKHASDGKAAPFLHAQPTATRGEEERATSRYWPCCCKYVTNAQKKTARSERYGMRAVAQGR